MPRRNLIWLFVVAAISLICYHKVRHNRYGETLAWTIDLIERRALEPPDGQQLYEGAMDGLVHKLDPYSGFIPAKELQQFNEEIDQEFGGVGMEVVPDPQTGQIMVGSPLFNSPAARADVRAGDHIVRINGKGTRGLSLNDAVRLMRGPLGEEVTLTLERKGETQPLEKRLKREKIHIDTVVGESRNEKGVWNFFLADHPGIGYVRITNFGKETATEFRRALEWLAQNGMRALVLDLRDDHGGLLLASIGVCDLLISEGTIVSIRGRQKDQIRDVYTASGGGIFTDFPMAVLINGESASASEIVAACLQDHKRAVVIGERSFGKGTVQEVIDLEPGHGALRLTTASYWRPSRREIHRRKDAKPTDTWGVEPDKGFEIAVEGEELTKLQLARMRREVNKRNGNGETVVDRQLNKAGEYLEEKLKE